MNKPWLAFVESNTSGTGPLFIRAAGASGFRPILLARDSSRYGFVAHEQIEAALVDTHDDQAVHDACSKLAKQGGLAGITSSSEYFIATAARVARDLGLSGPDPVAVQSCRDKRKQRRRLERAGVAVPQFRSASSVKAALIAAREMGFPLVVKPVCGSGSVGVKLCRSADELRDHAAALLKQRYNERGMLTPHGILLEELVAGPEFSVETFDDQVVGITEKHLGEPPYFIEIGHDFPALLSETVENVISRTALDALRALGLGWGPAHTELRMTERGPTIIEVNPRLAGGFIPELVRKAQGIDLIAETIKRVVGQHPIIQKLRHRYASIRFLLPDRDGALLAVERLDTIREIPGVEEARLYLKPGESVKRRGDFRDRIGHVISTSDYAEDARNAVQRAWGLLRMRIESETIAAAGG